MNGRQILLSYLAGALSLALVFAVLLLFGLAGVGVCGSLCMLGLVINDLRQRKQTPGTEVSEDV